VARAKASSSGRKYRFSFGPWNIHEGADPFGPTVRQPIAFGKKLKKYRELGFEGVQFTMMMPFPTSTASRRSRC